MVEARSQLVGRIKPGRYGAGETPQVTLSEVRGRRIVQAAGWPDTFDVVSRQIAEAAGGTLNNAVKVNISLTDLGDFDAVNTVMASHFEAPYPARACVQVAALPKGADIEVEAILVL